MAAIWRNRRRSIARPPASRSSACRVSVSALVYQRPRRECYDLAQIELVVTLPRTRTADRSSVLSDLSPVVDPLPAELAGDPLPGSVEPAGHDRHSLGPEQLDVWHHPIRRNLGGARLGLPRRPSGDERSRVIAGRDPDRLLSGHVHEGGRHLSVVEELERPLAEAHAGERLDGVCRAAVDLDEHHQGLAARARPVDAERAATGQHHADAEDLARAEMPVKADRLLEELVEGALPEPPLVSAAHHRCGLCGHRGISLHQPRTFASRSSAASASLRPALAGSVSTRSKFRARALWADAVSTASASGNSTPFSLSMCARSRCT